MTVRSSWLLAVLPGLVLVGCADRGPQKASRTTSNGAAETTGGQVAPAAVTFRVTSSQSGRLVRVGGTLRFIGCGEGGEGRPVEDLESGEGMALVREFGAEEQGITVMVRWDGDRLLEIRYAGPEGLGCDQLPPQGEVEARGNEPFWFVRVDGAEAVFSSPEELEGIEYRDGTWSRPGDSRWRFEARRDLADGAEHLTLELTEARCGDSMSGARYPFRAVLIRNGNRMEGCALEGRRSFAAPGGR